MAAALSTSIEYPFDQILPELWAVTSDSWAMSWIDPTSTSLLSVGCGIGDLCRRASASGLRVFGCDPSFSVIQAAIQANTQDVQLFLWDVALGYPEIDVDELAIVGPKLSIADVGDIGDFLQQASCSRVKGITFDYLSPTEPCDEELQLRTSVGVIRARIQRPPNLERQHTTISIGIEGRSFVLSLQNDLTIHKTITQILERNGFCAVSNKHVGWSLNCEILGTRFERGNA
jgi:SAM-dependent methyltransferase